MDYLGKMKEFKKLTLRRQLFVRNLLNDPKKNGRNAARKSGFAEKSCAVRAHELLKDPLIQKVIQKHDELIAADHSELRLKIVMELCLIAFSDVKSFVTWSNDAFKVKDSDKLDENVSRALSEVSETIGMFGPSRKIKLHDKIKALHELNLMHGFLATEKIDLTNSDGNLTPNISVTLPSNGREKK